MVSRLQAGTECLYGESAASRGGGAAEAAAGAKIVTLRNADCSHTTNSV